MIARIVRPLLLFTFVCTGPASASPTDHSESFPFSKDVGTLQAGAPGHTVSRLLEGGATIPEREIVQFAGGAIRHRETEQSAPSDPKSDLAACILSRKSSTGPSQVLWWTLAFFAVVLLLWLTSGRIIARVRGPGSLTREANQLFEQRPTSYKARVLLLAALGYFFVAGLLLIALVGLGAFAYGFPFSVDAPLLLLFQIKLFILLLILIGIIIRALWVRLPSPEGLKLRPVDVPDLYAMIESVRRHVKGPRIHTVLLVEDFNAAISQVPRLGVLGWQKNYLVLGLPLLLALSREEVKSIVAHEYGHLSGAHGRIAAWVYRVRQTWFQFMLGFYLSPSWGGALVRRFLDWYVPYFNACSFALARANEYQADAIAAEVTSPRNLATALVTFTIQSRNLEDSHWYPLFKRAANESDPPKDAISSLRECLCKPLPSAIANGYLEQAMARETTGEDTHPSLRDRLNALEEPARLSDPLANSAAADLLGANLASLLAQSDARWSSNVVHKWRAYHEQVEEAAEKLKDIEDEFDPASAPPEAHWERACLIEKVRGPDSALPAYRTVVNLDASHVAASFAAGRILLQNGNRDGLSMLEKVMRADFEAVLPACELIYRFFIESGEQRSARDCLARARDHQRNLTAAEAERQSLTPDDIYYEHGLEPDAVEELRNQLAKLIFLKHAWLVRKKVDVFPERPFYILFFERRKWEAPLAWTLTLTHQLEEFVRFPGDTLVVEYLVRARRLGRRAAAVVGSKIC